MECLFWIKTNRKTYLDIIEFIIEVAPYIWLGLLLLTSLSVRHHLKLHSHYVINYYLLNFLLVFTYEPLTWKHFIFLSKLSITIAINHQDFWGLFLYQSLEFRYQDIANYCLFWLYPIMVMIYIHIFPCRRKLELVLFHSFQLVRKRFAGVPILSLPFKYYTILLTFAH